MAKAKRASITPELVEQICDMMAEGKTLRAACEEKQVTPGAIRYHFVRDEAAFAHSTRARELGCDAIADECIAIADDPTLDAADKRIRIDTRIRLIGKWSQRYGDKVTVNNKTEVTHKYDLDSLDDARLGELERILTDASRGAGGKGAQEPAALH